MVTCLNPQPRAHKQHKHQYKRMCNLGSSTTRNHHSFLTTGTQQPSSAAEEGACSGPSPRSESCMKRTGYYQRTLACASHCVRVFLGDPFNKKWESAHVLFHIFRLALSTSSPCITITVSQSRTRKEEKAPYRKAVQRLCSTVPESSP